MEQFLYFVDLSLYLAELSLYQVELSMYQVELSMFHGELSMYCMYVAKMVLNIWQVFRITRTVQSVREDVRDTPQNIFKETVSRDWDGLLLVNRAL